jgi:hypothetical protein
MKKTITLLAIFICTASLFAQNITYDLRWNSSSSLYELYVSRDLTAVAPVTTGGTSSVTIVFPTDGASGTRTVTHTSESVSTYNSAGIIRSPGASSGNDYYVFNSTGGASYIGVLNADVEILWMTFTASDGNSEARLFENDTDPNSTDTGMMGINARSEFFTITTAGSNDEFSGNVLSVEQNELLELSIFPNPASDKVNITSNNPIDRIEVYDISGKQVKAIKSTNIIEVSDLNSGIYLFKIWIDEQVQTKKIVVK